MSSVVIVLHGVLLIVALLVSVPAAVLLLQVAAACRRGHELAGLAPGVDATAIAVLVPAHDEAEVIEETVCALLGSLRQQDRLLVVADNCSDDTAQRARAAGADVVERFDESRRGKGHALQFGVDALGERLPLPAVVVVIDADCQVATGALHRLAAESSARSCPIQGAYSMRTPPDPSLTQRISAFAWIVRNRVRTLGGARLGWPCQLMGTGMAFPWSLLATAPLASSHLVEDLQLGIHFALAETPPRFCAEAEVWSRFPADAAAAVTQRTRWEHGHLSLLSRAAPRLLWAGLFRGRPTLVAMALDLAVPPLAALVAVLFALSLVGLVLGVLASAWVAFAIVGCALLAVALAVLLAWRIAGRSTLSRRDLLGVPGYVLGKLGMYARWLVRRETRWIRTRR